MNKNTRQLLDQTVTRTKVRHRQVRAQTLARAVDAAVQAARVSVTRPASGAAAAARS